MRFAVRNCKSRVADVAVAASRWEHWGNGESPEEGGREWEALRFVAKEAGHWLVHVARDICSFKTIVLYTREKN